MTTTTHETTTTQRPTPCPQWCDREHLNRGGALDDGWLDDYHVGPLGRGASRLGLGYDSDVRVVAPLDPDSDRPAPSVSIGIRGNGLDETGSADIEYTVDDLLGLASMFLTAATNLRQLEARGI